LGISVNNDGTISLNATSLTSELSSDYSGVVSFFQNSNSWGTEFSNTLNNLGTSSATGTLALALKADTSIESSLNLNVSNEQVIISAQQVSLTLALTSANEILQSIPSQLDNINELYSSISGYQAPRG
jgi:flagellar hook-associated protein 2